MELAEEATVTIKVVSVNGKRMSKALYNQLPRRSALNDHDCTVQGQLCWFSRTNTTTIGGAKAYTLPL